MASAAADTQIPAKYKACVYDKPGEVSTIIVEKDTPTPGPGEVLVRLTHSGVCHSDLSVMTSAWPSLKPLVANTVTGGHEGVGVVVALGPGTASADSPVRVGDRVGIKWVASACTSCTNCSSGLDALCPSATVSGYTAQGTFAQFALAPADYVTPIPGGVSSAEAAPMLCGGLTAYSALKRSGLVRGQFMAVFGAGGGLGHLAVQMAGRGMGIRVVGVDHSSKRGLVLASGAEAFVAFDQVQNVPGEVARLTGGLGAHAAVNTASSSAVYETALDSLRVGGRLVAVGIPEGVPKPIGNLSPQVLVFRMISLVGVAVGTRQEAIECLEMLRSGVVKIHFREASMGALPRVFEEMAKGQVVGKVVIDLWKDEAAKDPIGL